MTWILRSLSTPNTIRQVKRTIVTNMSDKQDCISPSIPELLTLCLDNVCIVEELIPWEESTIKGISGGRSLHSGKADDTDSDPVLEFVEMWGLLVGQEEVLSLFWPYIGSDVGALFASHEGKQEIWTEVEFVVAYCGSVQVYGVVEVVHYFSGTYQLGWLNSALELISSIEIYDIPFVLLLHNLNKPAHILQPAIQILLRNIIRPYKACGKGRPMNIIGANNGNGHIIGHNNPDQNA